MSSMRRNCSSQRKYPFKFPVSEGHVRRSRRVIIGIDAFSPSPGLNYEYQKYLLVLGMMMLKYIIAFWTYMRSTCGRHAFAQCDNLAIRRPDLE